MGSFAQDLRFAVRTLVRRPAFSVAALAILTLGIGGNVTMFAVVEQVLLTPLPFEKPHELVRVYERRPNVGRERNVAAFPDLADWKVQNEVFSAMVGWTGYAANLTGGEEPVRVLGAATTWEIFEVTGVGPALGRGFRPEDDVVDAEPVVVIAHGLWRQRFGADPEILGRGVRLDGQSTTVIGVMPIGAGYPASAQFWTPLAADPYTYSRGGHFMNVLARLDEGITLERARADMHALALRIEAEHTQSNEGHYTNVFPLAEEEIGDARGRLLFLMAAVGFVLLIVCTNLGNMQVARTLSRRRELAVRTALGARPGSAPLAARHRKRDPHGHGRRARAHHGALGGAVGGPARVGGGSLGGSPSTRPARVRIHAFRVPCRCGLHRAAAGSPRDPRRARFEPPGETRKATGDESPQRPGRE